MCWLTGSDGLWVTEETAQQSNRGRNWRHQLWREKRKEETLQTTFCHTIREDKILRIRDPDV